MWSGYWHPFIRTIKHSSVLLLPWLDPSSLGIHFMETLNIQIIVFNIKIAKISTRTSLFILFDKFWKFLNPLVLIKCFSLIIQNIQHIEHRKYLTLLLKQKKNKIHLENLRRKISKQPYRMKNMEFYKFTRLQLFISTIFHSDSQFDS